MRKAHYFFSIFAAVACIILFAIFLEDTEFILRIVLGYMVGAMLGELIFWDYSLATRILKFLFRIAAIIFIFWIGWFGSGIIGIIIAFLLASPLFAAIGAVLSFAFSVFIPLSAVLYPIHLITYGRDLD